MRTVETFVLGAITGALVVWFWGTDIEDYVGEKTRGVRRKAAEGIRVVEEKTGRVLDQGGNALRRVDDFLQDTKQRVGESLRTGQETISPGSTAREA